MKLFGQAPPLGFGLGQILALCRLDQPALPEHVLLTDRARDDALVAGDRPPLAGAAEDDDVIERRHDLHAVVGAASEPEAFLLRRVHRGQVRHRRLASQGLQRSDRRQMGVAGTRLTVEERINCKFELISG